MSGVDLSRYRFDYDLTFCCLLMNADGTTYHVYGGRDSTGAESHLSIASMTKVLERTLRDHAAYVKAPKPPELAPRRVVGDSPAMQRRRKQGKKQDCVHCHTIHDVRYEDAVDAGTWTRADLWIHPDPIEVGLRLDRDDQTLVTQVLPESAAAAARLVPGDRLVSLAGRPVATFGDVQAVLHEAKPGKTALDVVVERSGRERRSRIDLPAGWKEAAPEVFAWRPSKWPLSPKPGFGGRVLDAEEKAALGVPEDAFAFRVRYVVTWGPNRHTGRNARKAGIRKGDVVYDLCGKRDFRDMDHFHAWFRLTREVGTTCELKRVRDGRHETLRLPVIE